MGRRALAAIGACVLAGCGLVSGLSDLEFSDEPPLQPGVDANDALASETNQSSCDEPGLVARWDFEEGGGTNVRDCTSRHHDGVFSGSPTRVPGRKGMAVALNGGYLDFGDPAGLRITGALSTSMWVRLDNAGNTTQYLIGRRSSQASGWRLSREANEFAFDVTGSAGALDAVGGAVVFDAWIHMAAVFRPGVVAELYVGGQLVGTDGMGPPSSIQLENDRFLVGARGDGEALFRGAVDDVRVYDRALDSAEIATLAQP